ncbi:hypothetical protein ABTB86_19625, partial [Acinetobacter baumannii]
MYLIEFVSEDPDRQQAGFDVCLAIAAIELPLSIKLSVASPPLEQKIKSLTDFGMADLCHEREKKAGDFYLVF